VCMCVCVGVGGGGGYDDDDDGDCDGWGDVPEIRIARQPSFVAGVVNNLPQC
jgi:hypothetical protein